MLDRSPRPVCIECGLPYEAPAYWSDRGLLCSPVCATAHVARRRIEGTEMREPAPAPMLVAR